MNDTLRYKDLRRQLIIIMPRPRQYDLTKEVEHLLHEGLSNRQIAKKLGTSEATIRRTKKEMDNPEHRLLFQLPPMKEAGTAIAIIQKPPYPDKGTGDKALDLALWLADCASTGNLELLKEATDKWKEVLEPKGLTRKVMEKRYGDYLVDKSNGNVFSGIGSIGAFDLEERADKAIKRNTTQNEVIARFGSLNAILEDQPPEKLLLGDNPQETDSIVSTWRGKYYSGIEKKALLLNDPDKLEIVRDRLPEPRTLDDILREHEYWDRLRTLRYSIDDYGDPLPIIGFREVYIDELMTHGIIKPRDKREAARLFKYIMSTYEAQQYFEDKDIVALVERLFL